MAIRPDSPDRPDDPDRPVEPAVPGPRAAALADQSGGQPGDQPGDQIADQVADQVADQRAHQLARAARRMHQAEDLDTTLEVAVEVLTEALPHHLHVGIGLLRARDDWSTHPASAELAQDLDELQHRLGAGPVVQALLADGQARQPGQEGSAGSERPGEQELEDPVLVVPDLRAERRWAAYLHQARARGVTAQAVARLAVGDRTLGAISVYATAPDGLGPQGAGSVVALLRLFAAHAAVAVDAARGEANLRTALRTRKIIGQAVGLVMERYGMDQEHAFSYLVRLSSNRNIKLREIAAELVDQANQRRPVH